MECPKCGSTDVYKDGKINGHQAYRHNKCPENGGKAHRFKGELETKYITEDQIRQRHDMFYKLKKALESINAGEFIEEQKVLKQLGMWGKPGYRSAVEANEIKAYRGKADGTVYYGHPERIQALKEEGVLS